MRVRSVVRSCCSCSLLAAVPAAAQQTGAMSGKVTDTSGGVLPGVTVEARSDVLPSPRVAVTEAAGEYRLPALPPGNYTVTFTLSGMQTVTRQAQVQLGQDTVVDAALGVQALTETVNVTATVSLIERDSASLKSGVSNEQIMSLPVGQEYRDLLKLIPGVQYSQDTVRGPSAGGSGQDNVYNFDGVNVTLPLFGTLAVRAVVARHRAGHHRPRRRARRRLRSLGRLHASTRSASRAPTASPASCRWQVMTQRHGGGAPAHQRVALRAGPQLVHRQRRRAGDSRAS